MKRKSIFVIFFTLLLFIFIIAIYYYNSTNSNNDRKNVIITTAYNYIPEGKEKNTIVDWQKAGVEEIKYDVDLVIYDFSTQSHKNIKNIEAYKVTFDDNSTLKGRSLLGPIVVYIDRKTMQYLGTELRE